MRRLLVAVAVCLSAPMVSAQKPATVRPLQAFEETSEWFRLATAHEPGRVDAPLRAVADWPLVKILRVRHDMRLLARLMRVAAGGETSASASPDYTLKLSSLTLRVDDVFPLIGLPNVVGLRNDPRAFASPTGVARRQIAVVMAKAAMFHTDLMLAATGELKLGGTGRLPSLAQAQATRIIDGEATQTISTGAYWEIARLAMDQVAITPSGGDYARKWYYATTEFLLSRREYDSSLPHTEHGQRTLPHDGRVAFYLGVVLENLAAPRVQVAVGDTYQMAWLDPKPTLLLRATEAFRAALELDPSLIEASLRLAHVLEEADRYDDAVVLLERIETALESPELRYHAALFLGRAHEVRDRVEAARAAYTRARALFPAAQSPHLALARLAWLEADTPGATASVRALPEHSQPTTNIDPWWVYDILPAATMPERVAAARQAFTAFLK